MPSLPKPTDGELALLRVLWDRGPSTVRQIHDHLHHRTAYTSVLKLLQIMTTKRLVTRDESAKTHIYAPAQPAAHTQRHLLKDLLDRAFAGSSSSLVLHALAAKRASKEELAEIRRLLDHYHEKGDRP